MDTFFLILKKSLTATIFIIFAFVATYVPQTWNGVETVHAGPTGQALEVTQWLNKGLLHAGNVISTATKALTAAISFAVGNQWLKDNVLDGLAWALAKMTISKMVSSLINWINSGFKGRPAFVQDLQGFLLDAADQAFGEYIDELGGLGSFLCSPFKLDVRIALELQYQRSRIDQAAPTCTLTGIIDNIEDFMSGEPGSFVSSGGWNDWFDIVGKPQTYTPYGTYLAAEQGARARVLNARDEELNVLKFGDGFLSGEICNLVHGPGGTKEECFVSKPGKVIQEALSFNLDSGRQSLIEADEINEVIAALFSQLANKAITGAKGLLGLSGGTGHTYQGYSGGSYLNATNAQSEGIANNGGGGLDVLKDARDIEIEIQAVAQSHIPLLEAFIADPGTKNDERTKAEEMLNKINAEIIPDSDKNITDLNSMINDYNNGSGSDKAAILSEFTKMDIHTEADLEELEIELDGILDTSGSDAGTIGGASQTQFALSIAATNYSGDLKNLANDTSQDPDLRQAAASAAAEADQVKIKAQQNSSALGPLLEAYQYSGSNEEREEIMNDFNSLDVYTEEEANSLIAGWDAILSQWTQAPIEDEDW